MNNQLAINNNQLAMDGPAMGRLMRDIERFGGAEKRGGHVAELLTASDEQLDDLLVMLIADGVSYEEAILSLNL